MKQHLRALLQTVTSFKSESTFFRLFLLQQVFEFASNRVLINCHSSALRSSKTFKPYVSRTLGKSTAEVSDFCRFARSTPVSGPMQYATVGNSYFCWYTEGLLNFMVSFSWTCLFCDCTGSWSWLRKENDFVRVGGRYAMCIRGRT